MSVLTFSGSAPNYSLTLRLEEEDGVIASISGVSKLHCLPLNLGGLPTATHALLGPDPNRKSLHISYIYSLPRKLGLRHNSKSRLDTSGAPIKPHNKSHD